MPAGEPPAAASAASLPGAGVCAAPGCGIQAGPPRQSPCRSRPGREGCAALPCPGTVRPCPAPLTMRLTGKPKRKALPVVLALLTVVCGGGVHVLSRCGPGSRQRGPARPCRQRWAASRDLAKAPAAEEVPEVFSLGWASRWFVRGGAWPGQGPWGPLPALGNHGNLPGLCRRCQCLGAARAPVW